MIWQDYIITVGCFGFALALLPSIFGKNKPSKASCLITVVLLTIISFAFATLKLWLSMASELIAIIAWLILYFQQIKGYKK